MRAEWLFLSESGMAMGLAKHLPANEQIELALDFMTANALATAEIEGDLYDGDTVRASIRRHMGLAIDDSGAGVAMPGVAGLTVDVVQNPGTTLTEPRLVNWYRMVAGDFSRESQTSIHRRAVQGAKPVRSGEPSPNQAKKDIGVFLRWFETGDDETPLSPILKAGLAHLWFESIHPFPSGNGPIGRALAETALLQGLPVANYTPLSPTLLGRRQEYHRMLDGACRDRDLTAWLTWFATVVVEACRHCRARIDFAVAKTNHLAAVRDRVNSRQEALLRHLYRQPRETFARGITVDEYRGFAEIGREDAKTDLDALVSVGSLKLSTREGEAFFHLDVTLQPVARVQLTDIM